MTTIIAVANHKGGSGKTTTAYYLGQALASMNKKTLLIDLDDQATLTSKLHIEACIGGNQLTIADVLDGTLLTTAYHRHERFQLDYITADHRLAWVAAQMQASSPNHAFLRRAWQQVVWELPYEYVLIDCPPSAGVLLINALALAQHVIIPCSPTEESFAGLLRMQRMITELSTLLNHPLNVLAVVATMVSPLSNAERRYITSMDGVAVQSTLTGTLQVIPRRVGVAANFQLSLAHIDLATDVMSVCEGS